MYDLERNRAGNSQASQMVADTQVGKHTLAETQLAGAGVSPAQASPNATALTPTFGGDDLFTSHEDWNVVHMAIGQIYRATPTAGDSAARMFGKLYGHNFQDGNRPDHWLQRLLCAYNEVVSGKESARAELDVETTYMPAEHRAYVLQWAKPRAVKRVPPKGPAPQIIPAEKKPLPGQPGARPRNATDDRIDQARKLAASLRTLRDSFDERNGFHMAPDLLSDTITPEAARVLIEKRLPELEEAIQIARTTGNEQRLTQVMHTAPLPWLLEKYGDGAKLAAHLRAEHKRGVAQLEVVGAVGEIVGGPIWGTLFGSIVEVVKYASNEQSAAETIANIAAKTICGPLDKVYGGKQVRAAFTSAAIGFVQSAISSELKLAAMKDQDKAKQLRANVIKKAILDAFISAVCGRVKILNENMDDEERKELVGKVLELAAKLGIELQVKDELDKFLDPDQK